MCKMKQIIICFMIVVFCRTPIFANESSVDKINELYAMQERKDVTVWKFKEVNGILYKRLYNITKGIWVGNWIKC